MEQANFEKLRVYQQSLLLVEKIYNLAKKFPKEELYSLTQQFQKAAISVSLNIAEGQGRSSKAENRQFLQIARGSLHEILAILEIAHRQRFITEKDKTQIRQELFPLLKQIHNMINYFEK